MVSRGRTIDCRHCFDGMCVRVGVGCYPSWAERTELPSNLGFQGSQIDFQPRQIQCRIMPYFFGNGSLEFSQHQLHSCSISRHFPRAAFLLSLNHIHKRAIYPKVSLALIKRKWPLVSFPRRTSQVSRQTVI